MEHLSGNLSDFALPDILQILALCQKTGVLSLEGADYAGKIMVERGRITYASATPGESLADRLLREQTAIHQGRHQRFPGAVLAAGVSPLSDVEWVASQHFRVVVAEMVTKEKGRFWIDVNQESLTYPPGEFRLREGLDIAEVLLEAARETDEEGLITEPEETESITRHLDQALLPDDPAAANQQAAQPAGAYSDLLYSYLAELRSLSFEAEVSLLAMRFASEIAARGVLFVVNNQELRGLGQFGFKSELNRNIDGEVRNLRITLPNSSILSQVVMTGKPYIGPMLEDAWRTNLLNRLGIEIRDCSGFVAPINCGARPLFMVYGDDYSGTREIRGAGELMILTDQASLVLDKLRLERMLQDAG